MSSEVERMHYENPHCAAAVEAAMADLKDRVRRGWEMNGVTLVPVGGNHSPDEVRNSLPLGSPDPLPTP